MTIEYKTITALTEEQQINFLRDYLFGKDKIFTKPASRNQTNDFWYEIAEGPIRNIYITHRTLIEEGSPNPNQKLKAHKQTSFTELNEKALAKMQYTNPEAESIYIYRWLIKEAIDLLDNEYREIVLFYSKKNRKRPFLSGHDKSNIRSKKKNTIIELIKKIIEVEEKYSSIAS